MSSKQIRYIIFFLLGFSVIYIIFDSTSQPNVNDLKGDFKEVAVYRNENNTGPIVRFYAVTVKDSLWEEMEKYGELMPYTKYGSTKVYFFQEGKPVPKELVAGENDFDISIKQNCLAQYSKDANGQVSFVKNPFKP